jgi:hypothetical protein
MRDAALSDRPIGLRELVLTGYPRPNEILDIIYGLASPRLRTFVCFGLACHDVADYDQIIGILRQASPNLTTLEFPLTPFHGH